MPEGRLPLRRNSAGKLQISSANSVSIRDCWRLLLSSHRAVYASGLLPKLQCDRRTLDGALCGYTCNDPSSLTRHRKMVDHLSVDATFATARSQPSQVQPEALLEQLPASLATQWPTPIVAPVPIKPAASLINYVPFTSPQYAVRASMVASQGAYANQTLMSDLGQRRGSLSPRETYSMGPPALPAEYGPATTFTSQNVTVSPPSAAQGEAVPLLPPLSLYPVHTSNPRPESITSLPSPSFSVGLTPSITPSEVSPLNSTFSPYSYYSAYSVSSKNTTPLSTPCSTIAPPSACSPYVPTQVSYSPVPFASSRASSNWSPSPSPCLDVTDANSSWLSYYTYAPPSTSVGSYEQNNDAAAYLNDWTDSFASRGTSCSYSGTCQAQTTFKDRWGASALQLEGVSYDPQSGYYDEAQDY